MSSIHVDNLSIKFRIYHDRSPSFKDYFANLFRHKKQIAYSDFWAIKNVSFKVNAGDRVGIIGHNGAGKSTLLKALCRVYESSDGIITVNGRIAPLLEIERAFIPNSLVEKIYTLTAQFLATPYSNLAPSNQK